MLAPGVDDTFVFLWSPKPVNYRRYFRPLWLSDVAQEQTRIEEVLGNFSLLTRERRLECVEYDIGPDHYSDYIYGAGKGITRERVRREVNLLNVDFLQRSTQHEELSSTHFNHCAYVDLVHMRDPVWDKYHEPKKTYMGLWNFSPKRIIPHQTAVEEIKLGPKAVFNQYAIRVSQYCTF
jgi:hypothetical protein